MPKKKNGTSLAENYYNYYEEYPKFYNYKSRKRTKYRRKLLWQTIGALAVFLLVMAIFRGNISLGSADKEYIRRWATQDGAPAEAAQWAEESIMTHFVRTQAAGSEQYNAFEAVTVPVSGKIVSRFGWQKEEETFNKGIVIETDGAYAIKSAYAGQVTEIKEEDGYYTIVLNHQNGLVTTYGNCGQVLVRIGQWLEKGETLGYTGICAVEKGRVYFEVKRFGEPVDPLSYTTGREV